MALMLSMPYWLPLSLETNSSKSSSQTPIPDSAKLKDESCRSTSATSRTDVNYEDYCAVYDKFWV